MMNKIRLVIYARIFFLIIIVACSAGVVGTECEKAEEETPLVIKEFLLSFWNDAHFIRAFVSRICFSYTLNN